MPSLRAAILVSSLLAAPVSASAQNDSGAHAVGEPPTVAAVARSGPIAVDGRLDEPDWQAAPFASGFRQREPDEGEPATQRTEVRFLYDDRALYIGARMFDTLGGAGVRARLVRRDQDTEGDHLMFVFDTFHDHAGRTTFAVTPAGSRYDAGQASPYDDPSWDPVWEVATEIDSLGWTAELRIPFSQLRYARDSLQTWGMQIWRYTERVNETTMWSFWGKKESGGPQRFGHLQGVGIPERQRGIEVLPYAVARAQYLHPAQPNPLQDATDYGLRLGGDLKALLSSTLTLDATINPDFGQVEVDPAVINLSAFETFFEEKRPFFVEGSGLFGFGGFSCYFCSNVSSLSLFYSRRIGRQPQGFVTTPARHVHSPENTTILGAAKVTGRSAAGWQIGLLDALTQSEDAEAITSDGRSFEQEVEPFANYFVGRVKRNYRSGRITLGAIGTSVARRFRNHALRDLLPEHAEAAGFDWNIDWGGQTYNVLGNFAVSQVSGDTAALLRLQRSSARYFQRPDRQHGGNGVFSDRYDPRLTALRGAGGYLRVAKEQGDVLWETALNFRTPGFEVNDLAFLTRADYVWMNANVFRQWTKPTRLYRRADLILGAQQQVNFDGDRTDRQMHAFVGGQLPNLWRTNVFYIYTPETDDDRLTRGGPVVRRATSWRLFGNVNTDSRKRVVIGSNANYGRNVEGMFGYNLSGNVRVKPTSNVSFSLGPSFSRSATTTQFVSRFSDASATGFYGQRVVFADLIQRTLAMETRVSATFSPTLTLEVYAQPLVASGEYSRFKEFAAPRTTRKLVYDDAQLQPIRDAAGRDSAYVLDPDRDPATANFTFANPDFNSRSLRGNAVLRWEYRPGSTLYLVWQQQRSGSEPYGDFGLARDAGAIFREKPDNIFLVKVTHWIGR